MYCRYCGKQIIDVIRYCPQCGMVVQDESPFYHSPQLEIQQPRKRNYKVWSLVTEIIGAVLIVVFITLAGIVAEMNVTDIILNIITTMIFYSLIPVIVRIAIKKPMEKKRATKFAIINSVVIFLLFQFIYVAISVASDSEMQIAKGSVAVLWFWIARGILRFGHEDDNVIKFK